LISPDYLRALCGQDYVGHKDITLNADHKRQQHNTLSRPSQTQIVQTAI